MSILEISGLSKHYGKIVALDGLTVNIDAGITGLVGANGAGKSTLVKLLLGLVDATSGSARVMGHDIVAERAEIRSLVGYMPEHDCLPPDISAAEFVAWLARVSGLPNAAARERTAEVLRHVGLFEERYRPMGGYSTGMAQRVKLAQALVHDPRLLILDEPTNGLDPAGRDEMLTLIERTGRDFGMSVLVSSHLLGELERICNGVVVLDEGRLLRADLVGAMTGATMTLVVEVDGDAAPMAAQLTGRGLAVTRDFANVLVQLPDGSDDAVMRAACDSIRDAAVALDVGLLRIERRRGHLEDLFQVRA
ncbi:MAG: ABC transporter ATP-binding protein [Gemmatimonadota bacterium]|nr:ABC transporter ATP-binding protein [Gemmatimonadota bacterium]